VVQVSDLANELSFQLLAAKIHHRREVCLVPERKFRTDILAGKLAIEVDGATWIGGRHARGYGIETDCEKQNLLAALGYVPMRFTRKQVKDGRALSWIEQALVATREYAEI
jgi:very-short-patch-repair endonuclease